MTHNKTFGSLRASLILLFALVLAAPLVGQNSDQETMENADFSDGSTHWHGDCKPAGSDMTTDFVSNPASDIKGIVVGLHSSSWTKVTQEIFKYKGNPVHGMVLTIVYHTSPDFKLSTRGDDYADVGAAVGFGGAKIGARPGQIMALIDMPPPSRTSVTSSGSTDTILIYPDQVAIASFAPSTDAKSQTFTARIAPPLATADDKPTFCLGFPPGNGSITITRISLQPWSGASDTDSAPN